MVAGPQQFAVCENLNAGQTRVPWMINLQHDFASSLDTRLAAPVIRASDRAQSLPQALIPIQIEGDAFLISIAEMAAVPQSHFGRAVLVADDMRFELLNAIDYLLAGY